MAVPPVITATLVSLLKKSRSIALMSLSGEAKMLMVPVDPTAEEGSVRFVTPGVPPAAATLPPNRKLISACAKTKAGHAIVSAAATKLS